MNSHSFSNVLVKRLPLVTPYMEQETCALYHFLFALLVPILTPNPPLSHHDSGGGQQRAHIVAVCTKNDRKSLRHRRTLSP
jgi:hypothetical protein